MKNGMTAKQTAEPSKSHGTRAPLVIGAVLILIGAATLFSRYLAVGWIPLVLLPIAGIVLLVEGARDRSIGMLIPGMLLLFTGAGLVISLSSLFPLGVFKQIGLVLTLFGFSWAAVCLVSFFYSNRAVWWALVPAAVFSSTGLCFLFTSLRLIDFSIYVLTGLGLSLLVWGKMSRLLGLIIPGSLLIGIGPGLFLAWGKPSEANSLAQTGVMLVWFALGWVLIILFTRMILEKFIWWPLIPGAVLAVVGWGLYIGGNPENAAAFIANTGSIGLIIFGLYLLFLRRGIQH